MRGHLRHLGWSVLAALALSAPALATPEIVVLGADSGDDPAAICGDLAAHPDEAGRDGRGVTDAQLFIDGAIDACTKALAAAPDSAEVQAWLARAYILTGRTAEARPLLDQAIAAGNPFAAYLLAGLLGRDLDRVSAEDPQRAVDLLVTAAEGGFVPAQSDLGERYELGNGVDADYAEALRYYEMAAQSDYGFATYKLGAFYHRGFGVAQDLERAGQYYDEAAAQGEPLGNTGRGQMYEFGEGVPQDYAQAATYYQRAADRGEKVAQTALAYLYEQGLGVEQDFDRSFALLAAAAGQHWGYAEAALSIHYLFGQGTPIDYTAAYDLAWAAQRQGIVYAEGILGYMFQQGLGVVRDLGSAHFHFQTGADKGDEYSAGQLPIVEIEMACMEAAGGLYEPGVTPGIAFEAIDPDTAIPACEDAVASSLAVGNKVWLARAYVRGGRYDAALPLLDEGLAAGNSLASIVMGDMLLNGWGVEIDAPRAVALYRVAAGDSATAQYKLGMAYLDGVGVAADRDEALKWLRMAESYGMPEAAAQVAALQNEPAATEFDLTGFGREGPGY